MENYKPNRRSNSKNSQLDKENYVKLPLVKINFIMMAVAGIAIILGFLLMLGGSSTVEAFNPDIFSTRRVVVGPTIAFLGFLFMGVAIIYRPKKEMDKRDAESE